MPRPRAYSDDESKVCLACGIAFRRIDLPVRETHARWEKRKFCSPECRMAYQVLDRHPSWKGVDVTPQGGRARAQRAFDARPCEICGHAGDGAGGVHRHHVDGDTTNNDPSNIRFLCPKHHIEAEQRDTGKRTARVLTPDELEAKRERERVLQRARSRRYRARKRRTS